MPTDALNRLLDALPRTRVRVLARETSAFLACGSAGYALAVSAAFAGGWVAGRDPRVVALLCTVCAASFFGYVYLRRWLTGREKLVQLEQVWTAQACCALVLAALREPVLPYLDVIAPAVAVFLAGGRVGCFLTGCCHGRPAAFGVAYGEAAAREGLPRPWVGVRLFPVQAVEAAGLALVAGGGLALLPSVAPGRVFAAVLAGHGVLRLATEELRGDPRPRWLRVSWPQWMALAQAAAAAWLLRAGGAPAGAIAVTITLALAIVAVLAARDRAARRRDPLSPAHLRELRRAVAGAAAAGGTVSPALRVTAAGVAVGVSAAGEGWLHVSLSRAGAEDELETLCTLAARALPGIAAEGARARGGVLHLPVMRAAEAGAGPITPDALRAAVARRLLRDRAEAARRAYFGVTASA